MANCFMCQKLKLVCCPLQAPKHTQRCHAGMSAGRNRIGARGEFRFSLQRRCGSKPGNIPSSTPQPIADKRDCPPFLRETGSNPFLLDSKWIRTYTHHEQKRGSAAWIFVSGPGAVRLASLYSWTTGVIGQKDADNARVHRPASNMIDHVFVGIDVCCFERATFTTSADPSAKDLCS